MRRKGGSGGRTTWWRSTRASESLLKKHHEGLQLQQQQFSTSLQSAVEMKSFNSVEISRSRMRLKLEGEFGVDLFSQDLWKSQQLLKSEELSGNLIAVGEGGENETPAIGTPVESNDHDQYHGES